MGAKIRGGSCSSGMALTSLVGVVETVGVFLCLPILFIRL